MDIEDILNTLVTKGVETVKTNFISPIVSGNDSDNIQAEIAACKKRLEELEAMLAEGFTTISEFNKFKEAQEIIRRHHAQRSQQDNSN